MITVKHSLGLALLMVLCACGEPAQSPQTELADTSAVASTVEANDASQKKSIVVLGDSVAAGEGINYGYRYDLKSLLGARWVGGTTNPVWDGAYPLCHDSNKAYGELLAADLDMNLAKFACTGATYENGITGQRANAGKVYRPAQFGNWQEQSNLNPEYDAAKPDTVLLTFGADDVDFVGIVTYCVLSFLYDDINVLEAELADAENVGNLIKEKLEFHYPNVESFLSKQPRRAVKPPVCTAENPGKTIEKLFWEPVNSGALTRHYADMVTAIQERGAKAGKVPQIVFTTYHNPLPKTGESIDCHDVLDLDRANLDYLSTLLAKLNDTIKTAVQDLPGVSVADLSGVADGHRWCSDDPWVYGLSVLWENFKSKAPFHPTPAAQRAIADIVKVHIK